MHIKGEPLRVWGVSRQRPDLPRQKEPPATQSGDPANQPPASFAELLAAALERQSPAGRPVAAGKAPGQAGVDQRSRRPG